MPRLRARSLTMTSAVLLASMPAVAAAPTAGAAPVGGEAGKVRICHRTNAVVNPYVSIEVSRSSVDGDGGNDGGRGDHYLNHGGPVWTSSSTRSDSWGDIIPPIPGVHDGRNWTSLGQAIWSAGCRPSAVLDTDGDRIPDVSDPDADGDRIPDASDSDDDGDGTPDTEDPDESTSADSDGDGVRDTSDSDDDGDGVVDAAECPVEDRTSRLRAAACGGGGDAVPPVDDGGDIDGDGTPDSADRDDDADGTPDRVDPDRDGDGSPDVTDPDDDGDRVPDVLDPDEPPVAPATVVDTDSDGTPDATDRDDDGDGVVDARDRDADGNGEPETRAQRLGRATALPADIEPGEPTVLWIRPPRSVIGMPALARIACTPASRSAAAGDVSDTQLSRSLCDIDQTRSRATVTVTSQEPTIVTVVFAAPAIGPYRALDEAVAYRVVP